MELRIMNLSYPTATISGTSLTSTYLFSTTSSTRTASILRYPLASAKNFISVLRHEEGGSIPTLTSVLKLMTSACSCAAFLCMAYKMFSSITASAISLWWVFARAVAAAAAAEEEVDVLFEWKLFLRFGMTVRRSWRGLLERLRTSTSQVKGWPT